MAQLAATRLLMLGCTQGSRSEMQSALRMHDMQHVNARCSVGSVRLQQMHASHHKRNWLQACMQAASSCGCFGPGLQAAGCAVRFGCKPAAIASLQLHDPKNKNVGEASSGPHLPQASGLCVFVPNCSNGVQLVLLDWRAILLSLIKVLTSLIDELHFISIPCHQREPHHLQHLCQHCTAALWCFHLFICWWS